MCHYVYPTEKAYVASHFCIGHVLDMRLIDLYPYIYFDACGYTFMVSLCESFLIFVECKCLCDVFLHYVCIFRHDYALCYGCMFPIYCYGLCQFRISLSI